MMAQIGVSSGGGEKGWILDASGRSSAWKCGRVCVRVREELKVTLSRWKDEAAINDGEGQGRAGPLGVQIGSED